MPMKLRPWLLLLVVLLPGCGGSAPSSGILGHPIQIKVMSGPLGGQASDALPPDLADLWQPYTATVKGADCSCIPAVDLQRIDGDKPVPFALAPESTSLFDSFLGGFSIRKKDDPRNLLADAEQLWMRLKDPVRAPRGADFTGNPPATLSDTTAWENFQKNLDADIAASQAETPADVILGYDPAHGPGQVETVGSQQVLCFPNTNALRAEISKRIAQGVEADLAAGGDFKTHRVIVLWLDRGHGIPAIPTVHTETGTQTPGPVVSPEVSSTPPARLITRPFAKIYSKPDSNSDVVDFSVPAFTIYNVVAQQDRWYQVSTKGKDEAIGWMPEDDIAEWRQNIVVGYNHPEGRKPVLFFGRKDDLKQLVEMNAPDRVGQASSLYDTISSGSLTPKFPVVSIEPQHAVNEEKQFYLLPIVDFETGSEFRDNQGSSIGRHPRLLKVVALTKQRGALPVAMSHPIAPTDTRAKDLKIDLVFVMDLTKSMGPFADKTKEMMSDVVTQLQDKPGIDFGFWAYRDDTEKCPGIGFVTKNYTPDGLVSAADFQPILNTAEETEIDSVDYEEDALAGIHDAVNDTPWRPDALHFIIMVGDAPGREPNALDPDPYGYHWPNPPVGTLRGQNEQSIRALATSKKVYIVPIYLRNPRWARYEPIAVAQWSVLGRNHNQDSRDASSLRVINGGDDKDTYKQSVEVLTSELLREYDAASNNQYQVVDPQQTAAPNPSAAADPASFKDVADNMFRGAYIEWLGSQVAPTAPNAPSDLPSDVTAWVVDKDLIDPATQSLKVEVYLTKSQLASLQMNVKRDLDAFVGNEADSGGLITGMQGTSLEAISGSAQALISALPYQSEILNLTPERLRALSPDEAALLRNHLASKLKFYQDFYDNPDNWQLLHPQDEEDQRVGAIPIDQMP